MTLWQKELRAASAAGSRWFILPLALWCGTLLAASEHWPQFRGFNAEGVNSNRALATNWSIQTGSNIRWLTPLPGLAHASPIIWGESVYVATAVTPGKAELKVGLYGDIAPLEEKDVHQWRLLSVDKATGKIIWDTLAHEAVPRAQRHPKATPCNSTPATDGRYIVALLGSEGLFCFDLSGKLVWKKDLGPMNSGFYTVPTAQWGFASSPVIAEGKVIVLCDVLTNSFLAAFELTDGKEVWRTARNDVPSWGTPTIVATPGRKQIVINGWHATGGYELATGRNLWRLDGGGDIPVPTPILSRGLIVLTSAHGRYAPIRAVRPDAEGDITPADPGQTNSSIAWAHSRRGNYMQTPIAIGDLLFACNDAGVVTCFNAETGATNYVQRLAAGGQGFTASPISDGLHIFFTSEQGKVFVLRATNRYSLVATNDLQETCLATPAISDGTLFFRTREKLLAVRPK